MLQYYTIDPLDKNLIINEQSFYLTSQYTDVKKITSVTEFLDDVEERHQREKTIR